MMKTLGRVMQVAAEENKSVSMKRYKTKRELNIGLFLFAILFVYMAATLIAYFINTPVTVYEVREGSIVRDTSFMGLVIRREETVDAEESGYINYFHPDNSKVRNGSEMYVISQSPLTLESNGDDEDDDRSISSEVQASIVLQFQKFSENYRSSDFSSVYSLKEEANLTLQNTAHKTKTAQLASVLASDGQNANVYRSHTDGVVLLSTDGMEGITKESFKSSHFDRASYDRKEFKDQTKVTAGEPVCRIITDDKWSVILPLDATAKDELNKIEQGKRHSIRVRIDKDSQLIWADFSVFQKEGAFYCCLDFDSSMIRYAQERFLNVELIFEDETGLKIPKASVCEQLFYVIPSEYITKGGNSNSRGVLLHREGKAVFTAVDIYNESKDGDVYVGRKGFSQGDILIKPDSTDTFVIRRKKPLQGVYSVNKGYAVFKKVDILCENDEYYIVADGQAYSLSNYDHIVQDAESITADQIVYQ